MAMFRAKILSTFKSKDGLEGILKSVITSTEHEISPTDMGNVDAVVNVIYTSPYSFHADGGFIAMPPDGTSIIVTQIGKDFYYVASVMGPDSKEMDEISDGVSEDVLNSFSCQKSYEKVYSETMMFPETVMFRHPKGHIFQMKGDIPLENEHVKPTKKVNNSKIEMKSASGKIVSLDDSSKVDALRIGVQAEGRSKDEFDGIIIGQRGGITGPRCIKTQAKNSITTTTDNGSIINTISDGNNFIVENYSMGFGGDATQLTGPDYGNISLGTQWGDINLTAGFDNPTADPIRAIVGSSKIIIEALGLTPAGIQPEIMISSDGNVSIFAKSTLPPGTIDLKAMGDINIESIAGSVNIKGLFVNLNDPKHIIDKVPMAPKYTTLLRGYVPHGWILGV